MVRIAAVAMIAASLAEWRPVDAGRNRPRPGPVRPVRPLIAGRGVHDRVADRRRRGLAPRVGRLPHPGARRCAHPPARRRHAPSAVRPLRALAGRGTALPARAGRRHRPAFHRAQSGGRVDDRPAAGDAARRRWQRRDCPRPRRGGPLAGRIDAGRPLATWVGGTGAGEAQAGEAHDDEDEASEESGHEANEHGASVPPGLGRAPRVPGEPGPGPGDRRRPRGAGLPRRSPRQPAAGHDHGAQARPIGAHRRPGPSWSLRAAGAGTRRSRAGAHEARRIRRPIRAHAAIIGASRVGCRAAAEQGTGTRP